MGDYSPEKAGVGDVRAAISYLGVRANPELICPFRGRRLHHRRVLVHGFHLVCQSSGDASSLRNQHIYRN